VPFFFRETVFASRKDHEKIAGLSCGESARGVVHLAQPKAATLTKQTYHAWPGVARGDLNKVKDRKQVIACLESSSTTIPITIMSHHGS
jgi:hypothetical protein